MDLGNKKIDIDLKLLAIINNDVFIKGTRNLGASNYNQVIAYLHHFINDKKNQSLVSSIFDTSADKQDLNFLMKGIDSLLQASKEIDSIKYNLAHLATNRTYNYEKDEQAIEQAINSGAKSFVSRIMKLEKPSEDSPSSVLMPGGWLGPSGRTGNAALYEFKKDKNGDYLFLVYNSGAGLQYHENVTSADKEKFRTVKAYKFPASASEEDINYFVSELVKPVTLPNISNRAPNKAVSYDARVLYEEVFRKIAYIKGEEIPLQNAELDHKVEDLASVAQRSATFGEKALQELLKLNVKDTKKSKAFIFSYKLYSIEEFIEQNKDTMDVKKFSQLKWAVQNLSKTLIKQQDILPKEAQVRAKKALEHAKVLLDQTKFESKQSQSLTPIANISQEKVLPEDLVLSKTPTIAVESSKEKIAEKPFFIDRDLFLLSELPKEKMPAKNSIYLEKNGEKLKYVMVDLDLHGKIIRSEYELDINIPEKELTKEKLADLKPEILNKLSTNELINQLNSATHLDLNKLNEFRTQISFLELNGLNKHAEQALFDYFTQIPLEKNYFLSITPAQAIEYVELTNFLAVKYIEVIKKQNQGTFTPSPKTTALLLNMAKSLDLLYQNNAVKIADNSGIDSFYVGGGLNNFKATRNNSAYLSTDIPEVDERTKRILKEEGGAPNLDLDGFMDYINKNNGFKQHLIGLFDKPRTLDIFDRETKANIIQQSGSTYGGFQKSRNESDRKAIVAFFRYFNEQECGVYKNELDKLILYKKMKACCENMTMCASKYSIPSQKLDVRGDGMFYAEMRELSYPSQKFYSETFRIGLRKSDELNLDQDLESYFTKINNNENVKPLLLDKKTSKSVHEAVYQDNTIFFYPEGFKVDDTQTQSEHGRLRQELMHLRTAPDLQIMTTVDYFKDKLHLFANKVSGDEKSSRAEEENVLKNDMQQYLRRNLFQPGLIPKEFSRNPDSYDVIQDNFLTKGILYFTKSGKISDETLFFYDVQQDLNQYALKSEALSSTRKNEIFTQMAITYGTLKNIHQGELNQAERYELSRIKLKMQLSLLDYLQDTMAFLPNQKKEAHYKNLFEAYMDFSANSRDVILNSPEKREELKQLKHQAIEMLKVEKIKDKVFDWSLEHIKENKLAKPHEWQEIEEAILKNKSGSFPYFYIKNDSGEEIVSIDMLEGLILIKGNYYSYPPDALVNSALYKSVCKEDYPKMSVSVMNKAGSSTFYKEKVKTYGILYSEKMSRFVETGRGAAAPYVYQELVEYRNTTRFCEKRVLFDNRNASSLMVKPQPNISLDLSLFLPESFYSSETNCWLACDNNPQGAIYIEKKNGQYVVDLEPGGRAALIKELDASKNETGFILGVDNTTPKMKSILEIFKGFDAPDFTEILFKPLSKSDNKVEEVKIKFPRYNLELKGKFDLKEKKWEIYHENNPNLILVHDANIQVKPNIDISNSLVFEDKQTKQRFLYTPVQDYYIDPTEVDNEAASETVYYQPKLDNKNISKRILQGKFLGSRPSLSANDLWAPPGAATYSNSEEFRIFPIDSDSQELKTATSEDKLHLAYLNLINLQPEEALNSVRSIIKSGGLKGTIKELELIEKIFNRAPLDSKSLSVNKSLRIDSPEFMAVRTHILYLISDLNAKKKTFSIPDLNKIEMNSIDKFIHKKHVEDLQSFERSIPELTHEHLNKSLNLYSATPKEMRLAKTLEYKMIPRLENGYSLGLLTTGPLSKNEVELLSQYISDAPILVQCKSSSRFNQNEKSEYWLIGKDKLGQNKVTQLKNIDIMNTLPFSSNKNQLNTVYVSEEKNSALFLEVEAKQAHVHQSKTVPLQARYEHLKNWYRTRELGKLEKKKEIDTDRKAQLEHKTARKKSTDTYERKVETKTIHEPLMSVRLEKSYTPDNSEDIMQFSLPESDFYPNIHGGIKETISKGDPQNLKIAFNISDINPKMTDVQFLERIIPIIELIKSTDSNRAAEREKLKGFLEDTLKANCKIRPEIQMSLIRNWAPSLLTALKNPGAFSHISLQAEYKKTFQERDWNDRSYPYKMITKTIVGNPNRHEDFVKLFFAQAYTQSKSYPFQIKDYQYYLKEDFDITSKKFKTEKYIPQPIGIKPSLVYENLMHADFIKTAGLDSFYDEMEQIKLNTNQEVDKLKIQLDMEIRESLLKQEVELLEAELKDKKNKKSMPESEILVLEDQLKIKREEHEADQKNIDIIKKQLKENLGKDSTESTLTQRAELNKKFKAITKEGRYQDTAEIKRQYDEKIGAVRNNEGEGIYQLSQKMLNKDSARDKAKDTCQHFISIIDPKIEKLNLSLLTVANSGPKEIEAQQKYRRELQARKKEPLNMGDLNRLFVLADVNEYKKTTGLDDDDIELLHNQMAEYVNLSVLKQQYNRIETILDKTELSFFSDVEKINEITQLGRTIATNNMVSPTGHADIQFFQKEENILITSLQNFYLDKLLNKDEITEKYRSEVIQLIMGGGKSKVLGPLAMLKKADGTNLAIFQVKNSLLEINYADMSGNSKRLFNQDAVLFKFDRSSPCSSRDLKALYNLFHKTSIDKGYVVTSGTSLQSLELKYLETLGDMPKNTHPKNSEFIEWQKQIKWFERSLTLFKTKGDRIIDEVHDELDPNKELNYTLEDSIPPTKEDIKLNIDVFYFLREVSIGKAELGIEKEIKAIDLIHNNKFITDPNTQMAKIMDKIASDLVNNLNTKNANPLAKIISKLDLKTPDERQALKEYLLNQNPELLPTIKDKLTDKRDLMELAFVKSQVSKFLPSTLLKNYNENYGPSRVEGLTQIKRRLAIPYTDLNTPNERSRFGEFTEAMNLTIQMNLIEPVSSELVTDLIKEHIEKAQTEQVDSLNAKFENTSASIEYNVKFGKVTKPTLEQIKNYLFDENDKPIGDFDVISTLFFNGNPTAQELELIINNANEEQNNIFSSTSKLVKISDTKASEEFDKKYRSNTEPSIIELKQISELDKSYFDCLVKILKESEEFKKVILSDYVLKQVENNPVVLTSNSQDSGDMTNTTQAMSGTPHNFKSYHRNIYFDESQGLGTDGETISLLKNKKTPVVNSSAYESATGLLDEYLTNSNVDEAVRKNTRAIIDVGALFKKEKSNFSIAKQIGQYCTDNPEKFSSEIKYVLYSENKGDELHAWDIQNRKKIKLSSSDEKEISKILDGCKPEERFTFYDQARITGTDIVQASGANKVIDPTTNKEITFSANAIATFSEKTTKSKFLQGVKRMRQFHNKQTVSVVKADYLKARLPNENDIDEVLTFVNQIQVDKALQLHFKSTGHKFKNALRSDFLHKIRDQEKDPVKKHALLKIFKPIFNKTYQPDHFLNHGAVETDQDAILYFPIMAEKYYDQWEKLLEEAGIEPSSSEKTEMKNALDELGKQAIDICEKVFKSKPIERVGTEMAQDDNLGNEVENELENELEIQIEKELELEKEVITYDKDRKQHYASNFRLNEGLNLLQEEPNILFKVNKNVITEVPFDDNIFMTSHQRQTVAGNFSNYYDQNIKPYHVVMMVAQKNKPETLQCVILTKEEAQQHIDSEKPPQNRNFNMHKDVWFVSCHDTMLHGKKPKWLNGEEEEPKPEDLFRYNRILEQVRYINGDLNAILQQKNGISWLNENAQIKLDFIANTIIKRFPESNKYYGNLKSRLDVTSKIFNYMQTHPFENYLDPSYNWSTISKGFAETADPESKAKINVFAKALHEINTLYENNYQDNGLSKVEMERNYDQQIAYRLNQHKENFLNKRTQIIEALTKNQSIDFVLSDQFKDIDLNFLVNKQTLFEIALNKNTASSLEPLFANNKIKWSQKNGDINPKTNAELVVLHAIKKQNQGVSINDTLCDAFGGKSKNADKVSNFVVSKNSDVNLLILAVKNNNLPLLQCIEEEYLSSFSEKDLKSVLTAAQKTLTSSSLPEIRKLIQTQGKNGDLVEKHKRLRTVAFDKIEKWIDSDYEEKSKLDFSKRPFSVTTVDFDGFTQEDKDFIKSVIDKAIINPNVSVFEFLHKKSTLSKPNMLEKNTALTDVLTHSEKVLDNDLKRIITILVSNQAEVKSAFALALESQKSQAVLSHLKDQKGVNIYFDPDKPEAKKQFLLLRNYDTDSTEEVVRKINTYHSLNADFSTALDYKGNAIIHNISHLEKEEKKLNQIIAALNRSSTFDINAKNAAGSTALHMAISSGNVAMVKSLLAQKDDEQQDKIDIDIQDANNKTAMDLVTDALQKDESFNPEMVTLITEAYQRKHQGNYLKEIAVESMLTNDIWDYLNDTLTKKEDGFKDKTLVNKIIHANSRSEAEFNIHKSELYKRLSRDVDDKLLFQYMDYIELYDNVQFDKNILGVEQKIADFDAPKLAEIKKEKTDKFPEKWPSGDAIATQVLRQINQNLYQDSFSDNQKIASFISAALDKQAKTIEEFYDAKKVFVSYIKTQTELTEEDSIFPKKQTDRILDALNSNPHKFIPSYKVSEPEKTTQAQSQEYSGGQQTEPEKDWSRMAYGYLADVISSGQYLNRYQDIPFNGFISGNVTTQEEFDKLKAETKKYLDLIFQDTIQEKEFVIGALDKVSFKSKLQLNNVDQIEKPQEKSKYEPLIYELLKRAEGYAGAIHPKNKAKINLELHSISKNENEFNEIVKELNSIVTQKVESGDALYKFAAFAKNPISFQYDATLHPIIKEEEIKNEEILKQELPEVVSEQTNDKENKKRIPVNFHNKNYTVIAKEIFNYAIPFTDYYEKLFNAAYKIKLKEHAKTTEDFDEINSELKVLFKKYLIPKQSKIATEMLNSVKASDLNLKASAPKVEPKKQTVKAPVQPSEPTLPQKPEDAVTQPNVSTTIGVTPSTPTVVVQQPASSTAPTNIQPEIKPTEQPKPKTSSSPAARLSGPELQKAEEAEARVLKVERALYLLEELEPLTKEMTVIQQKLQQARNIHDFTDYFGKKYQELLIPLDNKYKLSSVLGVKLEEVCEEVLKNPLSQTADNKQDIAKMIAAIKSSGDNIVNEINLSLSELLIRSWSFAKQFPPEKHEQENIILLLKDNVLAAGGCLPGIGARLVSAYSSCLRESLDNELYNVLQTISFEDIDSDQKSRQLANSALAYINQKTNDLKEKPLKVTVRNPEFKVDIAFINTLLHAQSQTSDEFYKNKAVLLKTIYQKISPYNPQKREAFDTVKTMFDLVTLDKTQLGKGNVPSDFGLVKAADNQASPSTPTVTVPQIDPLKAEKIELLKGYNTHITEIEELLDDVPTLQYLEKELNYKKFNTILTSAEKFYDDNKAKSFFADAEKFNLDGKINDVRLARTNFLASLKSDIEDKILAKPKSDLQSEKKEFEQLLNDLNVPELIYGAFEQKDKDELITNIKDKIQNIDKLINPVVTPFTPPVQPQQAATTAPMLNFDLALHCKASAWHNNCALNCLTHYLYSKLESNGVQTHFNNDPAYNLLRESFKDYYDLATIPTWDQIKTILDEYPIAHDREAVLAPVFRKYLSKVIVKEKDAIWNTEATAGISEYLLTGKTTDVAQTIIVVNEARLDEFRRLFDAEVSTINPAHFTQQEKEHVKSKMIESNETQDALSGKRRIKDPNNADEVNDQIIFEKRNAIEEKYNNLAYNEWAQKQGFCEKYADHMEQLSKAELVSVNQLGLIATELGIGLEVFTRTHKYNMGADVRPIASQDWVLKVYNPSQIHWEYEEPTKSKEKTIEHNNDYINPESGVFKTLSQSAPMSDENIKKEVVQKWAEKGFANVLPVQQPTVTGTPQSTPTQPNIGTGQSAAVSVTTPNTPPVQAQQQPSSTISEDDAKSIAEHILRIVMLETDNFNQQNISKSIFSDKIDLYAKNDAEFDQIKSILDDANKGLIIQVLLKANPNVLSSSIIKAQRLAAWHTHKPFVGDEIARLQAQNDLTDSYLKNPDFVKTRTNMYSKAKEILLKLMLETNYFKDPNLSKDMFSEKINSVAKSEDEFNLIFDELFGSGATQLGLISIILHDSKKTIVKVKDSLTEAQYQGSVTTPKSQQPSSTAPTQPVPVTTPVPLQQSPTSMAQPSAPQSTPNVSTQPQAGVSPSNIPSVPNTTSQQPSNVSPTQQSNIATGQSAASTVTPNTPPAQTAQQPSNVSSTQPVPVTNPVPLQQSPTSVAQSSVTTPQQASNANQATTSSTPPVQTQPQVVVTQPAVVIPPQQSSGSPSIQSVPVNTPVFVQHKQQPITETKTPNQKAQEVLALAESYSGGIHPKNKGKINEAIHALCQDESEFNKIVSEINALVYEKIMLGGAQYKFAAFAKNATAFIYDIALHPIPTQPAHVLVSNPAPIQQPPIVATKPVPQQSATVNQTTQGPGAPLVQTSLQSPTQPAHVPVSNPVPIQQPPIVVTKVPVTAPQQSATINQVPQGTPTTDSPLVQTPPQTIGGSNLPSVSNTPNSMPAQQSPPILTKPPIVAPQQPAIVSNPNAVSVQPAASQGAGTVMQPQQNVPPVSGQAFLPGFGGGGQTKQQSAVEGKTPSQHAQEILALAESYSGGIHPKNKSKINEAIHTVCQDEPEFNKIVSEINKMVYEKIMSGETQYKFAAFAKNATAFVYDVKLHPAKLTGLGNGP